MLTKSYRKRGITVLAGAKVTKADGRQGRRDARRSRPAARRRRSRSEKVLMAAGRAVNTEDMGLKEAGVQLDRPRLRQGEPRDAARRPRRGLLHRRRGRPADAGAQGKPGGRRRGGDASPGSTRTRSLRQRAERHLLPSRGGEHRAHRGAGKEKKLDYQVGRFPFSANGRARALGRDRRVREDHPRQEVRRDPRRAHRGAATPRR